MQVSGMNEFCRNKRGESHCLTESFGCGSISDEQFRAHLFAYEECRESNRSHHDTLVTDSPYHALVHELLFAAGHLVCRLVDYYLFENVTAIQAVDPQ